MGFFEWRNPNLVSFSGVRQAFFNGTSSPRELLEQCIDRLTEAESRVHAFVEVDLAAARTAADAATRRYRDGQPLSDIDGCPFGVKDIIATRRFATRMGSPSHRDHRPFTDAACVHALLSSGAVLVGKTVTTEFAIGLARETSNPFDPQRTPGGSSSGSAAAVGAGMLPVALATQTQASILRPASYCGAYGFKPTHGTLRLDGTHIMSPTSDHLGVIGGSLQDIWLTASQMALAVGGNGTRPLQRGGQPLVAQKPRRLVRLYTSGWDEMGRINGATRGALPISDDAAASQLPASASQQVFDAFVERLSMGGVEVIDRHGNAELAQLEAFLNSILDQALDLIVYEMQWPFRDYVERFGEVIGPRIHQMVAQGAGMSPEHYRDLLEAREQVQARLSQVLVALQADGFVLPASSGPAPLGLAYTGSRTLPSFATLAGFPSITLPGLMAEGLPFGVQLFHLAGRDADLCDLAHWIDSYSA